MIFMRKSKHRTFFLALFGAFLLAGAAFLIYISAASNSTQQAKTVTVTIPDGLRKEQTAAILAQALNWSDDQVKKFIEKDTARDLLHVEGSYPGSTYVIPVDASTYDVASMLLKKADERYQQLGSGLDYESWWQVLKMASIIEREAKTSDEMPSLASALWDKVLNNKNLNSDATVQYARDSTLNYWNKPCLADDGKTPIAEGMVQYEYPATDSQPARSGCIDWRLAYTGEYAKDPAWQWWAPVTAADRAIKNPYNTYLYAGLPENFEPIATPSIAAIEAVLGTDQAATWRQNL
jgi:cell division protein YceG involved in septum cleavage